MSPQQTTASKDAPVLSGLLKADVGSNEWNQLVGVVQELSMARSLPAIMKIVRTAARRLTGADGASFVLRENDNCFYADEDAVSPLWKGKRFPMSICVSGWVMLNRKSIVIPDVYVDPRVPLDAYRVTFVKSLAMVPIRTSNPIGAVGVYWAKEYTPTASELAVLAALADTTCVAMENVRVYESLENRVRDRTIELESANKELEAFSYSVSHDLRAPLRAIKGFAEILNRDHAAQLNDDSRGLLNLITEAAGNMNELINAFLSLSRVSRSDVQREQTDLNKIAGEVVETLHDQEPTHDVTISIADDLFCQADPALMKIVLENLISNAWKYSSKSASPRIEIGKSDESNSFFVSDNGAGFDMAYAGRLFTPFQRLHTAEEFPGIGIGLATVQRIINNHGGRIWAESAVGHGTTFHFTLTPQIDDEKRVVSH